MENEKQNLPANQSTDLSKPDKPNTQIARALERQEATLTQEVALKALKLVEPMIESVSNELTNTLGDNETIILIRVSKRGAPATIVMLDTAEDFTIKGAKANNGKFLFTGAGNPETKKLKAVKKFYIIREFVDMLLTGRMNDLTKKLME